MGGEVPWSLYSRWPQKAPFLTPPATPKFAWAPLWTLNPPPVTKSHGTSFVVQAPARPAARSRPDVMRSGRYLRMALPRGMPVVAYGIAALADATMTSATPLMIRCSALTPAPFAPVCCSLRMTEPQTIGMVWFRAPLTDTGVPLMDSPSISESPDPPAPDTARARARMK